MRTHANGGPQVVNICAMLSLSESVSPFKSAEKFSSPLNGIGTAPALGQVRFAKAIYSRISSLFLHVAFHALVEETVSIPIKGMNWVYECWVCGC